MEKVTYRVQVNGEVREYEEGTSFEVIANDFQSQYEHKIVLGCSNHKLIELCKELKKDCDLKFITIGDEIGNKTYKRSICLMLVKAVHDVCNHLSPKRALCTAAGCSDTVNLYTEASCNFHGIT